MLGEAHKARVKPASERDELAGYFRLHGVCKSPRLTSVDEPGHGVFSLDCERGRLEVTMRVEDGSSRIAGFSGESFGVSPSRPHLDAAARVHALLERWSDQAMARHLDPSLDVATERRRFEALRRAHGPCQAPVARSLDARNHAYFTLACAHGGDLELRVRPDGAHPGRVESFRLTDLEPASCPRQ